MRRPIRPFVTEYKSRSQKSPPRAPAEEHDAEPRPRFLETPAPAPRAREDGHDDGYEAAMKAADLIFGKKLAPAEPVETTPAHVPGPANPVYAEAEAVFAPPQAIPAAVDTPAAAPTGRILPSLIENEFAQPAEREAEPPPRKRGRPRKVVPVEPQNVEALQIAEPKAVRAPAPTAKRATRRPAPEPDLVVELDLDDEFDPTNDAADATPSTRRPRRPIQTRWVLRTELMAGEKWKRRLTDRSRSR
jgi:hypothetical protein